MIENFQIASIVSLGFLLGLKHALETDHLVAVSTITQESKNIKKALLTGASWGLGHTSLLLIIGIGVLIFKISISEQWSLFFEMGIGMLLIILGIQTCLKIKRKKIHIHRHDHGKKSHLHLHSHQNNPKHDHHHGALKKSFLIGGAHGLAGSGALMLLILATAKTTKEGILYLLIFGIGSTLGMSLLSALIGVPFLLTQKMPHWGNRLKLATGTLSIFIGILMVKKISEQWMNL